MFQLEALSYRVGGKTLLDSVTATLRDGDLTAVLGPNGAGKSTLLRCLAGLLAPSAGRVLFDGRPVASYPRRDYARAVCYVAQWPDAWPSFTVEEFVRLARYAHGAPFRPEDRRAVEDGLALTGAAALRDRRLTTLSGGERQLALLAGAVAQESRWLLLDEPAAFLDAARHEEMLDLLARLHAERGLSTLWVTHDANAALHASRRALGLRDGRLVFFEPTGALRGTRAFEELYGVALPWVTHPETGLSVLAPGGARAWRRLAAEDAAAPQ